MSKQTPVKVKTQVLALTDEERKALAKAETSIERWRQSTIEAALALKDVHDRKLYRENFKSFDAYLADKAQIKRSRAYQLIDAAGVQLELSESVQKLDTSTPPIPLPTKITQIEALRDAPPEKRATAWQAAKESSNGKEPTAAKVREAVKRQADPAPELDPHDDAGNPIPAKLRPAFDNAAKFDSALQSLAEIATELNPLMGDANEVKPLPGGEFLAAQRQYLRSHLKNARETLKACKPYAVCPYCKGGKAKCDGCKGVGYVPRQIFDEAPKELRK